MPVFHKDSVSEQVGKKTRGELANPGLPRKWLLKLE